MPLRLINWRIVLVNEFEGSLALMFHIRQRQWISGAMDARRLQRVAELSSRLHLASLME